MDISEKNILIDFLEGKGFKLDELTERHLRMERHSEGDHCRFEVLFAPTVLPIAIKWNGKNTIKITKDFDDLKIFLGSLFG